jgi:amino acid adenylation domain-containing protein
MSKLRSDISSLTLEQRTILEVRLKQKRQGVSISQGIPRKNGDEGHALSFAQQRLWFLDQLEPGSAFYNGAAAMRLQGRLSIRALEEALSEIVRRHEVLRTTFEETAGRPLPLIAPARPLKLNITELSNYPAKQREAEALRLAHEDAERPFDLSSGPLLRINLLRLSDEDHIVTLTIHHIIFDRWSTGILLHELTVLYDAFLAGRMSPLAELSIQYTDYAHWQRDWLRGEMLEAQLSYWKRQLTGATTVLELPTDRARPAVQSFRGAKIELEIPHSLTSELRALSQQEGATLFMTLLAAFQILLSRYTGQEDISVGSPIAGRTRAEIEPLIGFFVNTLVLRTDLSGNPSFRELLQRVKRTALGAYGHQDVPFEKLVEELQPERDMGRHPLFQVMFALQNVPAPVLELSGLKLRLLKIDNRAARFDMQLSIEDTGGLTLSLEYNADLFDEATISRLLSHFQQLLRSIIDAPALPISRLHVLSAPELLRLQERSHPSALPFPGTLCFHQLFERQAAEHPNRTAVSSSSDAVGLSYQLLDERANQLSHLLISRGISQGSLVAICMERSASMLVATLATLKAGAAYVPLDPSFPINRLRFMLEDAEVSLLLTEEHLLPLLLLTPSSASSSASSTSIANSASTPVLCLDRDWPLVSPLSNLNPALVSSSLSPAYVIYTSGSTGRPKGVVVTHRSLVNFLCSMQREPGLTSQDTLLAVTTLSFDIAALELYLPLMIGATVYLASRDEVADPVRLSSLLEESRATIMQATPAMWRQLMEAGWKPSPALKMLCGGEALSGELARQLKAHGGELWNLYGPTETTIWSSVERVGEENGAIVSIGRPIANTNCYVLSREWEVLPEGVLGELFIGGEGVAQGYLRRAELTAERFIPDALSGGFGERLYATGDVVRRTVSEGKLEYAGRLDQQVKVRGYRIEVGEVEAALLKVSGVRECVVVARRDATGEQRLMAYVVGTAGDVGEEESDEGSEGAGARSWGELSAARMREQLAEELPQYMIPTVYVEMALMPLTPNGKVDRKRLPEMEARRRARGAEEREKSETEKTLERIWEEVLKVNGVGVEENFFELGGHSLLATQVISRVRETFKIEMPLRTLFERPTIARLAESIETQLKAGQVTVIPPIIVVSRTNELSLSFAQQRLWFINQLEPGNCTYNLPAAIRLVGRLDLEALEASFTEITKRHEVLRTTFRLTGEGARQVIGEAGKFTLPVLDLRDLNVEQREAKAERLARAEAKQPFDLARGPLLRAVLLKLDELEHVLLVTMHHIISDGWSMGVLVREMATLYEDCSTGKRSSLAGLPIQYADFAHWQREWLRGEVLDDALHYWKQQLAGAPSVLELPTDRPSPAIQTFNGARQPLTLPEGLTEQLRSLGQKDGATLFMTLLAAFQTLLSRYTGQQDILVGSPVAGRNQVVLEGLIGFFANTLVLRTQMGDDPTFRQLLKRVRETALGAYAHQDVPFEIIVEELRPARNLSHTPLFQVLFVLQNAPQEALELTGLQLHLCRTTNETAKFDLELNLTESVDGLKGFCEYNTDLFDAATISRLVSCFHQLLDAIVAHPDKHISRLSLLSHSERLHLLRDFNPVPSLCAPQLSLQTLFERQVARTPERIALVSGDYQLSFSQLNERANQLAHRLIASGAAPDSLVAICCDRSAQMAVAVLAVIKAGAAYLPLDPAYPAARLQFMLDDARPRLLLTQEPLLASLPAALPQLICLDSEASAINAYPTSNPKCLVTPEHLLYVIYTSGSTGQPKGVSVPHRVVSNLVEWHLREMLTGVEMLQFASLSFDASIHEMMAGWLGGSALHIVSEEMRRDALELARYIREHEIAKMILPVVVLQQLAEQWKRQGASQAAVREITTTGEQMQLSGAMVEVMERWSDESKSQGQSEGGQRCAVYNHYGPSETHVLTSYRLSGEAGEWERRPPIGKPITNTQLYILDEQMELVPQGVRGELYLGGDGVGRGYVNRAVQTAERFVPDAYSAQSGARMYRTGDVGRYREDGNIEYLGRRDEQVKVRGHRVEMGEVEAALSRVRGVKESVVVMEAGEGGGRLIAYVVGEDGEAKGASELREELGKELPEYMIPGVYVELKELPLTANGKVDKRALPAPEQSRPDLKVDFVPPRTPAEEVVAGIWAQVLGVERVGVHDNFFELGGHSLLTTQVVSRLNDVFRVEVPLRSLFRTPTVEGLVNVLAQMWGERELVEEIARTFKEVEKLSDDELNSMLSEQE